MKLKIITWTITILLLPSIANADGIDLVAYFSRVPTDDIRTALFVGLVLMIANYILNYIVVGSFVAGRTSLGTQQIALSLVSLTILGQVADRIGAVIAGISAGPVSNLLGISGEGGWFLPLLGLNFIFSGIMVGMLVYTFGRRKWNLAKNQSRAAAFLAAVLTNPAWAIGLWFIYE
jgi:hypothetical protein